MKITKDLIHEVGKCRCGRTHDRVSYTIDDKGKVGVELEDLKIKTKKCDKCKTQYLYDLDECPMCAWEY